MPEHYQTIATVPDPQTEQLRLKALRETVKRVMEDLTDEQIALAFEIMRAYNIDKAAS